MGNCSCLNKSITLTCVFFELLLDPNGDDFDGCHGVVVACGHLGNLQHQVVIFHYLAKDGVCRGCMILKPVQKGVV